MTNFLAWFYLPLVTKIVISSWWHWPKVKIRWWAKCGRGPTAGAWGPVGLTSHPTPSCRGILPSVKTMSILVGDDCRSTNRVSNYVPQLARCLLIFSCIFLLIRWIISPLAQQPCSGVSPPSTSSKMARNIWVGASFRTRCSWTAVWWPPCDTSPPLSRASDPALSTLCSESTLYSN